MGAILKGKNDWWRLYMVGLHAALVATVLLRYNRTIVRSEIYGEWPHEAMIVLAGLLYFSSLVSIYKSRPLAVSGLLLATGVMLHILTYKEKMS